jgi:hypothetical protein
MSHGLFRYLILISLLLLSFNWVVADENPSEISKWVSNLGPKTALSDLTQFRKDPHLAVHLLVAQLTPVTEVRICPIDKEKHTNAMKVLWSIRALRYLTGQDFTAETKHQFGYDDIDDQRNQMLHHLSGDKDQVTFFGVWMSRDCVYFAPLDAQNKIIEKWKEWLKENGDNFIPVEGSDPVNSYF